MSDGRWITIGPANSRCAETESPAGFNYPLPIPGAVKVGEAGLEISVERVALSVSYQELRKETGGSEEGSRAYFDEGSLSGKLTVRNWHPGDSIRPLGLNGRKKLQDLFVDRKVDRSKRYHIPIVTDKIKGVVWVVGHTMSDEIKVTSKTEGMLLLRATMLQEHIGGAG